MGNIKQESKFIANICEGGARVPYDRCLRGGYGLIQWTSKNRYLGLGRFASRYGCNPSTLECQTRYMINEDIFQKYLQSSVYVPQCRSLILIYFLEYETIETYAHAFLSLIY